MSVIKLKFAKYIIVEKNQACEINDVYEKYKFHYDI